MGEEEAELTRKQLGWSYKPFEVPQDAYEQYRQAIKKGEQLEEEWNQTLATYKEKYPNEASQFERMLRGELPEGWDKDLPTYTSDDKGVATRKHSQICLGALGPNIPELIGGCLLYTSPSPRDQRGSRMPSSA